MALSHLQIDHTRHIALDNFRGVHFFIRNPDGSTPPLSRVFEVPASATLVITDLTFEVEQIQAGVSVLLGYQRLEVTGENQYVTLFHQWIPPGTAAPITYHHNFVSGILLSGARPLAINSGFTAVRIRGYLLDVSDAWLAEARRPPSATDVEPTVEVAGPERILRKELKRRG